MEDVLAFARQYVHIVPFFEIDDADRACLAANRLRQRVRWRRRRREAGPRWREVS